jgi:hypothetical protein
VSPNAGTEAFASGNIDHRVRTTASVAVRHDGDTPSAGFAARYGALGSARICVSSTGAERTAVMAPVIARVSRKWPFTQVAELLD